MTNRPPAPAGVPAVSPARAGVLQAVLLLAGSCMPVLGSVLITPVLPQLSAHFANEPGADVLVPLIVSTPALLVAIFAPFAGQIVDRLGRKPLLIVAMLAYAVLGTAPLYLDGLWLIIASRALVGVCEAAIMTVCTALILDYFHEPTRRARYLGLQTVATTLAATIFIALGGALGVAGWRTPFWVYAISIVVAIPMFFALWEPRASERAEAGRTTASGKLSVPAGALVGKLLIGLFGGFSFYVLIIQLSYLIVGTGVAADDTPTIGLFSAIASLSTAVAGILFARASKLGPNRLIPLAFGLQALGMIVIWFGGGNLVVLAIAAIVASFGSGLLLPSLVTWIVAGTTFAERGRVTGWWTTVFFLGQFLSPIVTGILAGIVGGMPIAVGVVGIATAIMAVVGWAASRGSVVPGAEVPGAPASDPVPARVAPAAGAANDQR
ncbi:MAG: MFS transporter [Pseudoclavibacter sp.]